MTLEHDYLNTDALQILDENSDTVKQQVYLNSLPSDHVSVLYSNNRFIPSDEKELYFYVENIQDWFDKYVFLDKETQEYLNNNTDFQTAKTVNFMGFFGKDAEGNLNNVVLRNISFEGNFRVYYKLFYDKEKGKLILYRDKLPYSWQDINTLSRIKNFYWHRNKKNKLNLDKPIIVTEGLYDSLFFENSIAAAGVASTMVIPEKLKKRNLIFVLDNSRTSRIYRASVNLLKMGYTVFTWPQRMNQFKDFTEYAEYYYWSKTNTFYAKNDNLPDSVIPKLFNGVQLSFEKHLVPTDEFINEVKNSLKKLVFSSNNLVSDKDLKAFDKRFSIIYG